MAVPVQRFSNALCQRERLLTLYRKGTIDGKLLDRQMAEIKTERQNLTEALETARERLDGLQEATSRIGSAEILLRGLDGRLDEPITWELKRELVKTLVEGIRVDTVSDNGRKEAIVHVTYRFDAPKDRIETRTDTRVDHNRGSRIGRSYRYLPRPPALVVSHPAWTGLVDSVSQQKLPS